MLTRGYAKHPCTRVVCSRGLAVGHIRRYPLGQGRTKGANGEVKLQYTSPQSNKKTTG